MECAYCTSEGNWAYTRFIADHEKQSRADNGLISIEEPVYLCDYCYNCAFRISSSSLVYNHPQQPATLVDLERTLARYLNFADSRR